MGSGDEALGNKQMGRILLMICDILRSLREQHKMTQGQVADILGIERSTYAYYETSRTPSVETLAKLARLFSVSLDHLAGFAGQSQRMTFSAPGEAETDAEQPPFPLTEEEKKAVMLFRLCADRQAALRLLREESLR